MSTVSYRIDGMTCGHCVKAVKGAIGELDGVSDVDVDLENGVARVTSDGEIDAEAVKAAVEEAGYELAS